MSHPLMRVIQDVLDERGRQDAKWGEQNHRDGTGATAQKYDAIRARAICQYHAEIGSVSWADILTEEFREALAEADPATLREELVQAAAVIVAWVEAIDRRPS